MQNDHSNRLRTLLATLGQGTHTQQEDALDDYVKSIILSSPDSFNLALEHMAYKQTGNEAKFNQLEVIAASPDWKDLTQEERDIFTAAFEKSNKHP